MFDIDLLGGDKRVVKAWVEGNDYYFIVILKESERTALVNDIAAEVIKRLKELVNT